MAWVRQTGKGITCEIGWMVNFGRITFHSTQSREHAEKGLARKIAAELREWEDNRAYRANIAKAAREERRLRLVARLCSNVIATISDAKALGYCAPGIAAFQTRHGIGDSASLHALVKTGDPSAVRLAMTVARRVVAKKPQTSTCVQTSTHA